MTHKLTAALIQLHRRWGDARLSRWFGQYSIGQGTEALLDLTEQNSQGSQVQAENLAAKLEDQCAYVITRLDPDYPACFHALDQDAPPLLYVIGDSGRLKARSLAIIGMRKPTLDGKAAAVHMASGAGDAGWLVVSGNAPGIDSTAHSAVLDMETGETLVFPPVPLDQYKPGFRGETAGRVTIASPFPPGCEVAPWMFLRRNTLVATQCRAAFVAETGVRGGTLDTVKKLAARRRPTFATLLPGEARYASAHSMLAAGGVSLLDVLSDPASALAVLLEAAQSTLAHPPVNAAVLNDFFADEEWA